METIENMNRTTKTGNAVESKDKAMGKTAEHDEDRQPKTWFGILAKSCQYINEIENAYSMDISHI